MKETIFGYEILDSDIVLDVKNNEKSKVLLRKNESLLEAAINTFGPIVSSAYMSCNIYDLSWNDGMFRKGWNALILADQTLPLDEQKAKHEENLKTIRESDIAKLSYEVKDRQYIDMDYGDIYLQFIGGNFVKFSCSEWGEITKQEL